MHGKKIAEEHTVLVHGLRLGGGDAPVRDEPPVVDDAVLGGLSFENAKDRVGVAYIENQKHGLLSVECADSSREHGAQIGCGAHQQKAAIVEPFGNAFVAAIFFDEHMTRTGER